MTLGFIHEITGRCNLACAFCYNPWRADERTPSELSVGENGALLEAVLRDSGATWLTFAGGEPLLYEGLETVMQRVHQQFPKVRLGLATNGLLLPDRLESLVAAGLAFVEVSLTAEEAACRAIALSRTHGLAVTAAIVLHADLQERLEDLLRTAWALGADHLALNRFVPRGRGARHEAELGLTLMALNHLLTIADRVAGELGCAISVTTPVEDCLLPHTRYPHLAFGSCVCGASKWIIDPQGHLRVCELEALRLGDLRVTGFPELARHPAVARFRRETRSEACGTCTAQPHCGGGCRFTPGTKRLRTAHSGYGGGGQ